MLQRKSAMDRVQNDVYSNDVYPLSWMILGF